MERVVTTIDGNEAVAQRRLSAERSDRDLPDHALVADGRVGRRLGRPKGGRICGAPCPRWSRCRARPGPPGAVHGALQTGALATTFTASQGLLLMIPNMYKIAGELTPAVFHVAARTLATQALSIFGDHSDVMAARATGWAMLCVQLGAGSARLRADRPGGHARVAHALHPLLRRLPHLARDQQDRAARRRRPARDDRRGAGRRRTAPAALSPDHPVLRGTAQNPDVFFQAREAVNPYYAACPDIVQEAMDRFAALTGRAVPAVRLSRRARRRARDRAHGLGRRDGRRRRPTT